MERKEIFETVREFFTFLQSPNVEPEPHLTLRALVGILDKLAFAYHHVSFEFDENGGDPPVHDNQMYSRFREIAGQKFPSLSSYREVDPLELEATEAMMGDALDDLADIACDLQDVLWCLENTTEEDALWHFQFGYESHWGRHMRYLQTYLYELCN
jgi:hypothetical protein